MYGQIFETGGTFKAFFGSGIKSDRMFSCRK